MKIIHRTFFALVICLGWFFLAAELNAQAGATQNPSGSSPAAAAKDSPGTPPFARGTVDLQTNLQKQVEYMMLLRGLGKGKPVDPHARVNAIRAMEQQEARARAVRAAPASPVPLLSAPAGNPAWISIGPAPITNGFLSPFIPVSGRVTAIAVHPTNSQTIYAGAAQGGVYRSLDGGTTWTPIMDSAMSLAIGAIAIDPLQPSTIYVGTGEANFSPDTFFGVGVYRIDQADSNSPVLVGPLNKDAYNADVMTGAAISQILVDPTQRGRIFVATTSGVSGVNGGPFNTLPAFGLYLSSNATGSVSSVTFTKLTVATANAGSRWVTDMVMEPGNPNNMIVAVAGTNAAGDGGYYKSTNALSPNPTFTQTMQLDALTMKFAINKVVTPGSPPSTVVTVIASSGDSGFTTLGAGSGTVRISTDGGNTWGPPQTVGFCFGQCRYDTAVAIDPADAQTFFLGGSLDPMLKTTNGGQQFNPPSNNALHVDTHAIVFDPSNSNTMYTGNDGGIFKSTDKGNTWTEINSGFNATQFQSLALHPTDRQFVIGGTQDNGTVALEPQPVPNGTWFQADGGDGGFALIDQSPLSTTSSFTIYHTVGNDVLVGYSQVTTGTSGPFGWTSWGCNPHTPNANCDLSLFYAPIALGPGTPNSIYYGSDRLYRAAGPNASNIVVSQAPFVANVAISSIGISPQDDGVRIVGLQNGRVFATTSGSSALTEITGPIPGCFIARAVVDPQNKTTAYVTLSCYGLTAGQHVWKTTNLMNLTGVNSSPPTWNPAGSGIPDVPVSAFVIDPANSNFLYAGTDIGVYVSTDGGVSWSPFGTGLPRVAVFDIAIQNAYRVIRVATHGRGIWETSLPLSTGATTTTLTSSANPSLSAQSVTFSATVGPTPPNGEIVTFKDGTTTLGTGVLSGGVATFSIASLAIGTHSITASYPGDGTFGASTGSLTQVVNAPADAAQFLSQSVPSTMISGLYYHVTLNFKNTGGSTWDTTNYWLQSQNPSNNTTWGPSRVAVPTAMLPGYFPSFRFVARAPTGVTPNFQWRMVHSGTAFGDLTPNILVNVTQPPPYYQGCWVDDASRALPNELSSGGETVESCKLKAANAGWLFAGLQSGGQCFAGNNLGRSPAAEDECNTPCTANSSETCGGYFRNSIWSTVQIDVSWVKPSSASYGPPNTLTVQGDAYRGTGTVQMVWRDVTANGPLNTVAAQSTPSANIWANTIPSSNYCHTYAVYANYAGVTSATFTYVGVTSGYCSETAWVSWIQPPWDYPGPAGSLVVGGGSSGAPAGSGVTLWWNDLTSGSGWIQGTTATPDANGTWFNSIPSVNYSHQYSVYVVYDAYSTQTTQGPCTYPGNGGSTYCPR